MQIIYSSKAKEDLAFWSKNDPKIVKRIDELIEAIKINPYSGIGKPKQLRFELHGYYSRRINHEHRLAYKATSTVIYIAQCRYHY